MNKEYITPLLKKKITKNTIHVSSGGTDTDYYHDNGYNLVKQLNQDIGLLVKSIAAKKPLDVTLEKTDFSELIEALDSHGKKRMFNKLQSMPVKENEKPRKIKI